MKITIRVVDINDYHVLFRTFNGKELLFPRSRFPETIQEGDIEEIDTNLNNNPVIHNLGYKISP